MTVAELGARMSSAEFAEWMAYAALEPFGPQRDDVRAGTVAATLANIHRDRKARPSPFTSEDFFPSEEVPEETEDDKLARLKNMAIRMGAGRH